MHFEHLIHPSLDLDWENDPPQYGHLASLSSSLLVIGEVLEIFFFFLFLHFGFFLVNKRFLAVTFFIEASSSALYRLDVKIEAVLFFLLDIRDVTFVLGIGITFEGLTVNDVGSLTSGSLLVLLLIIFSTTGGSISTISVVSATTKS